MLHSKKMLSEAFSKRFPLIIITCCLLVGAIGFVLVANKEQSVNTRAAVATANCDVSADKISLDAEEQAFLTLINEYRQKNYAGPLKISNTLNQAAAWMANDIAVNNKFSHTDSLGRIPFPDPQNSSYTGPFRFYDCGYPSNTAVAENILGGLSTAQEALDDWKSSTQGHNENMLNPNFKVIGIARAYSASSDKGWYWSTTFGASDDSDQQPVPSIETSTYPITSPEPTQDSIYITPTVYCLGSCPVDPTPTPSSPVASISGYPVPSSDIVGPIIDPCSAEYGEQQYTTSAYGRHHRHHHQQPRDGFREWFLELIKWFLNLIGMLPSTGPSTTPGDPSPTPCVPSPYTTPELSSSPVPSYASPISVVPEPSSISASINPSEAEGSPIPSPETSPIVDPCDAEYSTAQTNNNGRSDNEGFFELLKQLLDWILRLLNMQISPTSSIAPTTSPCVPSPSVVQPTDSYPTNHPSVSLSPVLTPDVTSSPTATPTPTTAPSPTATPTPTTVPSPTASATPTIVFSPTPNPTSIAIISPTDVMNPTIDPTITTIVSPTISPTLPPQNPLEGLLAILLEFINKLLELLNSFFGR